MSASPFLTSDAVAARYGHSRRWVLERTRLAEIPHRRLPGSRRCLFLEADNHSPVDLLSVLGERTDYRKAS